MDPNENTTLLKESSSVPTGENRIRKGAMYLAAAALCITGVATVTKSIGLLGCLQNLSMFQASIIEENNIGSKSGKRADPTKAEEPNFAAVRARFTGQVTLGDLNCGGDTACVQSAQNALKAALEDTICGSLSDPLVPPCWIVVDPNPQITTAIQEVKDKASRRLEVVASLWKFVASLTIPGPDAQDTIDNACTAILSIATEVAATKGESIEVIVADVANQFDILLAEMDEDPHYAYNAVIPDVPGYQLVGNGYCFDRLRQYYPNFRYDGEYTAQACVAKCNNSVCLSENKWTLEAVEWDPWNCYCDINYAAFNTGTTYACTDAQATVSNDGSGLYLGKGTGQAWFYGENPGYRCFHRII